CTTEKVAPLLRDNPRGVTVIKDELTSWVTSMDQYKAKGKGSDRQFYLSAWAGEPVRVDRKNSDDPLFVPHPFLAVVGGLPPDLLPRLRGEHGVRDGFFDRILPSYANPLEAEGENWNCIEDSSAEAWKAALDRLWGLKPEEGEAGPRPHFVSLTA